MDFSVPGSNSWGSSLAQQSFIQSFFVQNQDSRKRKKSRKSLKTKDETVSNTKVNQSTSEDHPLNSTPDVRKIHPNFDITGNLSSKKKKKKKKRNKINGNNNNNSPSILEESSASKHNVPMKKAENSEKSFKAAPQQNITPKNRKKKNKIPKLIKNVSEVSDDLLVPIKDNNVSNRKRKLSKSEKKMKKARKEDELVTDFETKVDSEAINDLSDSSDASHLDFMDSDSDESDLEVLRSEIKSSKEFKLLQKFMKQAHDVNPNCSTSTHKNDNDENDLSHDFDNDDESDSAKESPVNDVDLQSSEHDSEENESREDSENFSDRKKPINKKVSKEAESQILPRNEAKFQRNKNKNLSAADKRKNEVMEKLRAAKFRFLNEKLYTETGSDAFNYFQENKEDFEDYHLGFSLQVSKWPMNPVDQIIADLRKLNKSTVIADMGCGEAKIAQTFQNRKVFSFDLIPMNELVTSCNVSKVPLGKESVDVVVFCLSLMGTNLKDYLCEAFRILKFEGTLKIAEVESRIESLNDFIKKVESIGFKLEQTNTKHKLFVFLDFTKDKKKLKLSKVPSINLKPCLYKKR